MNSIPKIPTPVNEPVFSYAPGTPERATLKQALAELSGQTMDIPLIIGGKEVRTAKCIQVVAPHRHQQVLANVHQAGPAEVQAAIKAAREAWQERPRWRLADRSAVFLKAAGCLAGSRRAFANATTMLGQSKTAHQAEIDAACELIDFFRYNVHYAERIVSEQPSSPAGTWNRLDHRSEEHTSELQSRRDLVCRLLLEKKKQISRPGGCGTSGRSGLGQSRRRLRPGLQSRRWRHERSSEWHV